jgi:hypothetical protein
MQAKVLLQLALGSILKGFGVNLPSELDCFIIVQYFFCT